MSTTEEATKSAAVDALEWTLRQTEKRLERSCRSREAMQQELELSDVVIPALEAKVADLKARLERLQS